MIDVDATRSALVELRQARRRNHREIVHWIDALYRVYITALGAAIFVVVGSGWLGDAKLDPDAVARLGVEGPGWLGLAFAVASAVGLRSGARGGPLALEAPAVQHELLAPIDHRFSLRGPALKQLRFLAFAGAVVGACVGVLAARRLEVSPAALVAGSAVAFGAAAAIAIGLAMLASGKRIGIWQANLAGLALLAWSAADATLHTTTSPFTMLASLAFVAIGVSVLAIVALVLTGVVAAGALSGLERMSLEAARRRAGLVSQLRFAVTLQDIRTVVLIRRQLAQERPRTRPWIRTRRGKGRLPATWRRDWQSYLRFPGARILRMLALAAVAGIALGFAWRGAAAAILVAALALHLAAYDAAEPIAQEVDHPTRWAGVGDDHGRVLLQHLPAAMSLMVLVCLVAAGTSLLLVPATVVAAIAPVLLLPVAAAAAVGGALSTVLGGSTTSSLLELDGAQGPNGMDLQAMGIDGNAMGFVQVLRVAFPPALTVAALAPALRAGSNPDAVDSAAISNGLTPALLLVLASLLWIRYRRPARA